VLGSGGAPSGAGGTGGGGGGTNGGSGGGNGGKPAGGGAGSGAEGGSQGAGGGATGFALTSPTLFAGMMFPAENTCAGADVSPAFDWTAGPAATQSYALVLTDMFQGLVHWVLWDIPTATRSLPAMLATTPVLTTPAGARQMPVMGMGYTGPCPSGTLHTYQFDLHAVDAAMLPVTAGASTTQLKALVMSHSLAKASLSAPSSAKRP